MGIVRIWRKCFVSGRTGRIFDPNAPITRAEMAGMAANALQIAEGFNLQIASLNYASY